MLEEVSWDASSFNPILTSRSMLAMADFAEHCTTCAAQPHDEFLRAVVDELRAAETWLKDQRTPFDVPRRELVLRAADDGIKVAVEVVIDTLRETALELVQMKWMFELAKSQNRH
jgi:hypothetical protein